MRIANVMQNRFLYSAWQAPFARDKIAPVLAHNDLGCVQRVLDVGCGPGTNARWFQHCDYTGVDMNRAYIEYARRRYQRKFIVADVTEHEFASEQFDFVLANSLLHHIADAEARLLLRRMAALLTASGHVHIIDLVLPESAGISRTLARHDRGLFPRPLEEWREMFCESFEPVVCEPFAICRIGVPLWQLVYFKGRAKL